MGVVADLRARRSAGGRGGVAARLLRAWRMGRGVHPRLRFQPAPPLRPPVPAGPPGVVAAFLVPGNPLPCLKPDNPPWQTIAAGFEQARGALDRARPDTLLVYSTQWIAVLDQLWQARGRCRGIHVDENWYEYGDLHYDLAIDTELSRRLVEGTREMGLTAKGVDYDGFPIDAGTIVAHAGLDPGKRYRLVIAANNLYHDYETTRRLGRHGGARSDPHGPAGRGHRGRQPLRLDLHPGDRHRGRPHREQSRRGMEPGACWS